jgi:outer membrane protein assembly factor BamB
MKKNGIKVLIFYFLFNFISCTGVDVSRNIRIDSGDWLMSGASAQQQNIAFSVIKPPFELLWSYNPDAGIGHSAISVSDGFVFVNNLQGELIVLDVISGSRKGLLTFLGNDACTTPLISEKGIILAFAGDKKTSLLSYDLIKKDISWETGIGNLQTSPILSDEYIYLGSLNGKFYKLNSADGKVIWEHDIKSQIHSTCAVSGGKIFFGSDNGILHCLNTDGKKIWEFKTQASVFSAPLVFENRVFFGSFDSNYYCLNTDDGSLVWKTNLSSKIFSGSALIGSSGLITGGISGSLFSLDIKTGTVNWKFGTEGVITSTPLVSGEYVYFSNHDYMSYAVDCKKGNAVWSFKLEGRGKTSPVIWKDYLIIASDSYIYCFSEDKKK